MSPSAQWPLKSAPSAAPHALAALLRAASAALAALAERLAPRAASLAPVPSLEFHAEAGAPEGALYADGKLIARLPSVTRL